jgi:CO dehydrogenase/acetyl-CoA synthase gamma subunit (corrinoid Fe-S protein)
MVIEEIDLYQLRAESLVIYLPGDDCGKCGARSCSQLAKDICEGKGKATACPSMKKILAETIDAIAEMRMSLPESDPMLLKTGSGLIELNSPDQNAPVFVTADSIVTVDVLKRIFSRTRVAAFMVPVDTQGYTLDNSVTERTFSPMGVMKALMDSGVASKAQTRKLIIPGLAAGMEKNIERAARWTVEVGPVSGFELPIYLAAKE